LVFPPLCSLVWVPSEHQEETLGNTREAISEVLPHVRKKICWEKIICYKGISTRFFSTTRWNKCLHRNCY
jgi:hypothetical protein